MQKTDYQTRFKFILNRTYNGKEQEVCSLNFYATPKEFLNPDQAVENSWEIVECFNQITSLFQRYMRGITEDYVEKNKELYEELDLPADYTYTLKLVDCEAACRDYENDQLSEEKEEREIYQKTIEGRIFYPVTPLSIIPIWKGNHFENNSKGIRDILKDCLSLQKYSSRFKSVKAVSNTYCMA